jgi:DNA-binding NtrC family response regulator
MGIPIQTALIIDDDVDTSYLLADILKSRKIHVLAVHSLGEAEECLSIMKPSVIFLDNNFPEGLGVNFISNIHSADEEIKIVMITADPSVWIKEKAIGQGINYFLEKPFSKKIIDGILDNVVFKKE